MDETMIGGRIVLLITHDSTNRDVVEGFCRDYGCTVDTVDTPGEALQRNPDDYSDVLFFEVEIAREEAQELTEARFAGVHGLRDRTALIDWWLWLYVNRAG